jgi:SET domain-containing protein
MKVTILTSNHEMFNLIKLPIDELPITKDFNLDENQIIGSATNFQKEGDSITCDFKFDDEGFILGKMFATCRISAHITSKVKIEEPWKIDLCSITCNHSDSNVPPITQ